MSKRKLNKRALLNFYSNADFSAQTDFFLNLGENPFLGYDPSKVRYKKAGISDVDGVFNAKDANPLYKNFLLEMCKENSKVKQELPKIIKYLKVLQTPGKEKEGELLISKEFRECNIKEDQVNNACREAAKNFIRYSLISGARDFIRKIDEELGYTPGLLSASPKLSLDILAEYLGIPSSNVYATRFRFKNGKFYTIDFMLGMRRLNAKNNFLKNRVDTKYGCYFIVDDDPLLNLCTLKSGLNPTIIVGDFPKKLPFDVSILCMEARDNLLNLVKPILRYEYAWIVYHLMDDKTIYKSFTLASEQKKLFNELMKSYSEPELKDLRNQLKIKFAKKSIQILNIKSKFGLITRENYIRDQIATVLLEMDESREKEVAEEVFKYFKNYIPETGADEKLIESLFS